MLTRDGWIRRVEGAGAAAVTALFLLSHAFVPGFEAARFVLGALSLFLIPGYLLGRLIWNRARWNAIEWICLSGSLSLGLDVVAAWAFYLIGADAGRLLYALGGLDLVLSLLVASGVLGHPPRPFALQTAASRRDRRWMWATLGFAAVLAVILLFSPVKIGYWEDTLGHIAVSREILDTGQIVPRHAFYAGGEEMGEDPRVGLFHSVMASLGQGSGTPMIETWLWLRPLIFFLATLSFSLFAGAVLRDPRRSLLAVVLFAFLYGGRAHSANMLIYPSRIGMCVFWTGVFLIFQYARSGGRDLLWIAALFLPLSAMIHVTPFINFWLTLATLCVFLFLLAPGRRPISSKVLKILAAGTVLALPYLLMRFRSSYGVVNPIHQTPQNVLRFAGDWLLPHPLWVLHWFLWVGLLAVPLGLSLGRRARSDEGLMLLFGNTVVGLALSAFPPFFTLGYRILNFLALRFMMLIPHVTILALFVASSAERVWKSRGRAVGSLAFLILFAALVFPDAMGQSGVFLRHLTRAVDRRESATDLRAALGKMDRVAHEGAVVLADPLTSYGIAAMTKYAVIAMPAGHSSPRDSLAVSRIHDVALALSPATPLDEALRIMRRYGVSFIVLNHTFRESQPGYGYAIDPAQFDAERKRFDSHPEDFTPVVSEDGIRIYRLLPETQAAPPPEVLRAGGVPECRDLPIPQGAAVFDGQFELAGARVLEDRAPRGADVEIVCCWKRLRVIGPEKDYRIHVRFERDYPKGRLWREGYSRLYRGYLEWRRKEQYRFRIVRPPGGSTAPPSRWEPGIAVIDSFRVEIPGDVAPGRYQVKVCLEAIPIHPEMWLSDIFTDRDRFDGVPIGWVEIR